MDRGLREEIKREADNHCRICNSWCGDNGSPHHITKLSEEKLLMNCKKNILWLCMDCHRATENDGNLQKQLKRLLRERYFKLFMVNKHYTIEEIAEIVQTPIKDLQKAMQKGVLRWEFVELKNT